jgi:signal transduction histidine kinase
LLAVPLRLDGVIIGVIEVVNKLHSPFDQDDLALVETLADSAAIALDNVVLFEALRQLGEEIRQGIAQVTRPDGSRASYTVDALLVLADIHRAEAPSTVPLDMASIVDRACVRLAPLIEAYQAEVMVPNLAGWPSVLGYAPWVEEVWVHCISNAIQGGGKPPRVELGVNPPASSEQAEEMVCFLVRDNGAGLGAPEQAILFSPFERIGSVNEDGWGLGLFIVRRIVSRLGGSVGVQSREGEGSRVSFTLPKTEA